MKALHPLIVLTCPVSIQQITVISCPSQQLVSQATQCCLQAHSITVRHPENRFPENFNKWHHPKHDDMAIPVLKEDRNVRKA